MSQTNYQVTIGYKAVICIDVKANSEEEARQEAIEIFIDKERKKWYKTRNVHLQDDTFGDHGIVDMDETWNQL